MLDLLSPEVHLVMGEGAASTPVWLYMSVAADEISGGRLNRKAKLVTSSCSFGKISVICVGNASETGEPSVSFSVLLTLETPV